MKTIENHNIYNYRYVLFLDDINSGCAVNNNAISIEQGLSPFYLDDCLVNGITNKRRDNYPFLYHISPYPVKVAIYFFRGKSDYFLFFWFSKNRIQDYFDGFYQNYPDSKIDFIFNIDVERNIYRISLSCEEADKPYILEEDACQLIVFKNKFERYRSNNYNQPRGAWIW